MIKHNQQTGGTVLGVLMGLIIGLGIAVAVAIAITKTSLPFTNKMGRQERAPDPSQPIDPNKPLYGNKDAAKEAAKEFVKPVVPENTVVEQAIPPVADKAVKLANKTAEAKTTDNKDKTAATSDGMDEKWTYFLQAGAFREPGDAESAKAKLALQGFQANITERQTDNGVLYRVRIGPFGRMEPMNSARTKLSDSGVDVAVVRQPK